MLGKITEDSSKQFDQLKNMLKSSQQQRKENENKLKLMIGSLTDELSKMCEDEEREGETTYDSLLRMLEECCDRIQQAQLR